MWLKQSTAVTVKMGPFLDSTDGNTAETGLTLTQADIRLSKNGGNMAQKNDASAATHDELGYYDCDLDATDTGTLGRLKLMVHESGALPVWHEYMVVTANFYDTMCSTDHLDVNAIEISGDSTAADNAELAFDGTGYGFTGCTMPTTTNVTNQVTADMTAISGDATAADNLESYCDGTTPQPVNATQISGDTTAADNAELAFDGTGYGFTGCTMPTTTDVTNRVTANTDQIEGGDATDAIRDAVVDDATRIDASALNTLSSHDPGGTLCLDATPLTAAETESEVNDALVALNLDHLLQTACPGNVITGAVVDNSVMAILAAIGGDISDYADTTDSQEALADGIAGISITADDIWDEEMDVNAPAACNTAREYMNVLIAALAGKTAGTGDWSARDLGDTKTRIQGTLSDAGARSSIDTLDGT